MGLTGKVCAHNPVVAETDEGTHRQAQEAAIQARAPHTHVNLHMTDWVGAQWEDPVPEAMINCIPNWKVQDLQHLLGDYVNIKEGMAVLQEQKRLMLYQGALYHCQTLAGELEEVLQFVVPMANQVATMNGCHQDAGHWGQQ